MDRWRPGASPRILQLRAELLFRIREFFRSRHVLEVETPSLSQSPALDLHIDPISVRIGQNTDPHFLITSPEYHMKRLLSAGSGSIYQICNAFRKEEAGQFHNPEFTIIEWYRVGWNHYQLMAEVDELLDELLNCGLSEKMSYQQTFEAFLQIDPFTLNRRDFDFLCQSHNLSPPADLHKDNISRDEWLDYLMGAVIQPRLGFRKPAIIMDYPATQACLSRLDPDSPHLAQRFEVFYKGIELGNGFHELTDAEEQKRRFAADNKRRREFGKPELPIDARLMAALEQGMPDCSGIAMGFDRIVALASGCENIDEVISFSWKRC